MVQKRRDQFPRVKESERGLHYSRLDLYIFLNDPRSHPEENEDLVRVLGARPEFTPSEGA